MREARSLMLIAARLGKKTLTRTEFARETGLSLGQVKRRLGRFTDRLREAGLSTPGRGAIADAELLVALRAAVLARGGDLWFAPLRDAARYSFARSRARRVPSAPEN